MYTQTHTQKCTHMCTCTYHTDVYSHTHAPQMYSHGNAYSCTHLYHTSHRCILTKNSCTHSHTCFTHHRCTFALTHVHTLTHKCMYTQHITHHTHADTLLHTQMHAHAHAYISHCADVHSHSHTVTCIAHSPLPQTHACSHVCTHTLLPATLWAAGLHAWVPWQGCPRPGLWVPSGLSPPPASASLLPHHPGPRPGLWAPAASASGPRAGRWASGALGPQIGRLPRPGPPGWRRPPDPTCGRRPFSSDVIAVVPGCLGAWVTGARLLPAEGAQGTAGHRLPPGRWRGAQLTLPRLTPAPPCREVPCSFGLLGHCVGEPQPALASISPHGLQCCGPITQGPWGPGEPGRAGQGRPQKPKTLSTM